jgi:hypothetical protein
MSMKRKRTGRLYGVSRHGTDGKRVEEEDISIA